MTRLNWLDLSACVASALLLAAAGVAPAHAQRSLTPAPDARPAATGGLAITWEVRNRFRLFRDERDFKRHVAVQAGRTVIDAEQALAEETGGRGWARDTVVRLCVDASGRVIDQCVRDGARESYLAPADHRVEVRLAGATAGASCSWTFGDADSPASTKTVDCGEPIVTRVRYGTTTAASVDVSLGGDASTRVETRIAVRDFLIAGLGDSIAAGEGNPDRPVALSDDGFCFRQFIATAQTEYFRPGRLGYKGDKACDSGGGRSGAAENDPAGWAQLSARWLSAACHRSLYGYQVRTALALAVENPHMAVTFLPLACTGATIDQGLFGTQRARDLFCGSANCPTTVPGQLAQLRDLLAQAQKTQPSRKLDLVLLTIGANDIDFSGLVAEAIIDSRGERALFARTGIIGSVENSAAALDAKLPADFAKLRTALKPLVGGQLDRVVYVSYGNPAMSPGGEPCPGSRDGFDVHPAFGTNTERLRKVALFVRDRFLPRIKALATCTGGARCAAGDAFAFADAHQASFTEHGFCARAQTDPEFDQDCFSTQGQSFETSLVEGAAAPLVCNRRPSEFRAYAPRARWIRTANDSYFAAMTFPQGLPASAQPADLHDATWGILSAVYGGAIHPTAEGHAAMADAALVTARGALGLSGVADAPVAYEPPPPTEVR